MLSDNTANEVYRTVESILRLGILIVQFKFQFSLVSTHERGF